MKQTPLCYNYLYVFKYIERRFNSMTEKKVIITCTSLQRDEHGKTDRMVLKTPGLYGESPDYRYVTYEETSLSGMDGTTTTIRMYDDRATLSRRGSFLQETIFRPGTVEKSPYMTPMGPIQMVTTAHAVEDGIKDGHGRLRLVFEVELKGLFVHLNEIIIDVREA